MANDPVASSVTLSASPHEADERAAHAALTATERGHNILTEYARRDRLPDTRMLVSTIARLEAARADYPPHQISAAFTSDLAELAALIEQVEAALAASEVAATEGLFAADRVQDMVWSLRQRHVEAAICEALEAGMREVGDAMIGNNAATKLALSSAALLRDLAHRVNDMIVLIGGVAHSAAALLAMETASESKATTVAEVAAGTAERLLGEDTEDVGTSGTFGDFANAAREPAGHENRANDDAQRFDDTAEGSATNAVDMHSSGQEPADSLPRPTPSDPLAAVLALSEEELIALFS
jgi:hypothetical protein